VFPTSTASSIALRAYIVWNRGNRHVEATMADSAIFMGWGEPVYGREQVSAKVFGEAVELWSRLQAEGAIESWEAFFLEPHGGDLSGFFLLRGDRAQLAEVRMRDDVDRIVTRGSAVVTNFGVVAAATGARIEEGMGRYLETAAELG
jgi:hypothetical protein